MGSAGEWMAAVQLPFPSTGELDFAQSEASSLGGEAVRPSRKEGERRKVAPPGRQRGIVRLGRGEGGNIFPPFFFFFFFLLLPFLFFFFSSLPSLPFFIPPSPSLLPCALTRR